MQLEQDNKPFNWTDEAIAVLEAGTSARRPYEEIAAELKKQFGVLPTNESIRSAMHRYCAETRRVAADETRRELETNRSRANELMATGKYTAVEIAEIMDVSLNKIYAWVPTANRPKQVRIGIAAYLSQFDPSEVPEDPIVDHGKVLMELEAEDCRWPIGKDADGAFRFCGCHLHRSKSTPTKMRPYCDSHTAMDRKESNMIGKRPDATFVARRNCMPAVMTLMESSSNPVEEMKLAA